MAIVQISRIQNRRGRELTETGVPQLAGGEFGWAVDTQKLYIGNGSVAEGAPAVGNTQVLTEHTDIFALANQYTYKETSNLWGAEVQPAQSLQQKLDQFATVFDFGVVGDGAVDDTDALQTAIDSLYIRALDNKDRVALRMPAGEYLINGTVYLPPYVTLIGDGIDKTIIRSNENVAGGAPLFYTVSGAAQPGAYIVDSNSIVAIDAIGENQARHLYISDMTIQMNRMASCFYLESCSRSVFRNLRLEGAWLDNVANPLLNNEANHHAIELANPNNLVANCKENIFENIQITKFYDAVFDKTATNYNRNNRWINCDFTYLLRGIDLGDETQTAGPSHNLIQNCTFDYISQEGIVVEYGDYNVSTQNRFYTVGNGNNGASFGSPALATYNNIRYVSNYTNASINDYFERTQALTQQRSDTGQTDPYVTAFYSPEVGGRVDYKNGFRAETSIGYTLILNEITEGVFETIETIDLLKVPMYTNGTVEIEYLYVGKRQNGTDPDIFVRKEGVITVNLHSDDDDTLIITDDGIFQGDSIYDNELRFGARLDDLSATQAGNDAIVITVKNLIPIEEDTFTYRIRVKS